MHQDFEGTDGMHYYNFYCSTQAHDNLDGRLSFVCQLPTFFMLTSSIAFLSLFPFGRSFRRSYSSDFLAGILVILQ